MPNNLNIYDELIGINNINWNDPGWAVPAPPDVQFGRKKPKKEEPRHDNNVMYFKDTVSQFWGRRPLSDKITDNYTGIEIENETKHAFELPYVDGWNRHREGSLRDFGFEYVSNKPVKYRDAKHHLDLLFEYLNAARGNYKLSNSSRTSTHVHLDAGLLDYGNIITISVIYWMLEEYLSNFCGDTRKGNLFCIRSSDSLSVQSVIAQSIIDKNPFPGELTHENLRYGSLNFSSLPKFGSIEFRMMRGVDNAEEAMLWVSILNRIKNFGLSFKNPFEFKNKFLKDFPAGDFPEIVLGKDLHGTVSAFLPKGFNVQKSVRQSFLSCSAIFSARDNWDFDKEVEEAKQRYLEYKKEMECLHKEEVARQKELLAERERLMIAARERLAQIPPDPEPLFIDDYLQDNLDQAYLGALIDGVGDQ